MNVTDFLKSNMPVLFDGANGTEYQRRGLAVGSPPELWNLTKPEVVKQIHREYIEAGSQVVTTNTFGGNRIRLRAGGIEKEILTINRQAVEIALSAADGKALVAGSIGPLGAIIEPFGETTREQARQVFLEQAKLLLENGVHLIVIETMISLEEAIIALKAAREAGATTISVTMTFDRTPDGPRTPFGESPSNVALALAAEGADIVGSNCGCSFDIMRSVAREMKSSVSTPILVQPNAGIPTIASSGIHYPETPPGYGIFVSEMLSLGVEYIGGCCGTTSEHIAEAARVIRAKNVQR
jgi:5-methyltetrahydrofolate--homocysteine methyltransferase